MFGAGFGRGMRHTPGRGRARTVTSALVNGTTPHVIGRSQQNQHTCSTHQVSPPIQCHLDDIRHKHHITFVEHKLFKCELYKLPDNNLYNAYPVASKTLPDKLFGRGFGHGGKAAYWPVGMSNVITPITKLSNDSIEVQMQ